MANFAPAGNVQIATIAGFLSTIIEHACKSYGIIIPDDVNAGIPAVVAVGVAWICDLWTGAHNVPECANAPSDKPKSGA